MDWKEATRQILAALDIRATYEELGIRFAAEKPSSGWIPCHAYGREDRSPSAGVNVSDSSSRGLYKDFGGSLNSACNLFEFASTVVGRFPDWRSAREHYAARTGVKLPKGSEGKNWRDGFQFRGSLTVPQAYLLARAKPGVSPRAVYLCGATPTKWYRQHLLTFFCWSGELWNAEPTGTHSIGQAGFKIKIGDSPPVPTMQRGHPGWFGQHGLRNLADAELVWIAEGVSDLLAMQTVLGDRTDHVVITMGASKYWPDKGQAKLLEGKDVRVVFDTDPPTEENPLGAGYAGSIEMVSRLAKVGAKVRNVRLPT